MFKGKHFDRSVILLCIRWYLAYNLSLRNLEEMMAERGISVDHATIHRWVICRVAWMSELVTGAGYHRGTLPYEQRSPPCPSRLMPLAGIAFPSSDTG
jgi:hypothetical protein